MIQGRHQDDSIKVGLFNAEELYAILTRSVEEAARLICGPIDKTALTDDERNPVHFRFRTRSAGFLAVSEQSKPAASLIAIKNKLFEDLDQSWLPTL